MIATPKQCLSDQEIVDFAAGRLPGDRFQLLLSHLDACERCQHRADRTIDLDDSFAAALVQPASDEFNECEIIAEADCQAALFHASKAPSSRLDSMIPPIESLGPYRLLRPLGRGGMGAVYLAEHVRLRKKCAVKLLPRERGFDADWLERFDREMQAIASLKHPNIVTATDAGDAEGWHYLVMEYLDGLDLAAVVRRLGPIPIDIATAIASDVCKALSVIHAAGLVHRDVKPSNVMLTGDGSVKVLDLGLVLDDLQAEPDMRLTTVGHVIGTLAFAAPEQLSNGNSVDARADLYGVGAMLFQLIAGRPAHESDRGIAPLVIEKTSKPARTLQSIRPDVPDSLNALVARLLDRDPENRPANASVVAEELTDYATTNTLKHFATKAIRANGGSDTDTSSFAWTAQPTFQQHESSWHWPKLLGIFGLPITAALLLAGFLFYVQTDRGILVIESDVDDLKVSIGHEDQLVDTLQISTGENQTVLRTGRYSIGIEANADHVSVSESQVAIRRGTKTIVKIRRQDGAGLLTATTDADANKSADEMLYKGKPLHHWVKTMDVEHDVSTLGDAMNAIASLAGADDVDAVHSILVTARRLGGWTSSHDPSKPTQRFMDSFTSTYARLLPQPGMLAIARELKEGNERSWAACLWALLNFDSPERVYGARNGYPDIESWAKNPTNRGAAIALHDALRYRLQRPEVSRNEMSSNVARDLSLKLALATGRSVADEPGLNAILQQEVAKASKAKSFDDRVKEFIAGEKSTVFMPLNPAQTIAATQLNIELPPVLAVRSLLSPSPGFQQERNEIFIQKFEAQPQTFADEAVLVLGTTTSLGVGGVFGFGGKGFARIAPAYLIYSNETLWKQILCSVVMETSVSEIAAEELGGIAPQPSITNNGVSYQLSEEMFSVVQEAMNLARSRIPAETSSVPFPSDGGVDEK